MKRLNLLLATVLLVTLGSWGATKYGLKVGGVDVTSDNCSNITGDNIGRYDATGEFYVKYNAATKTLTLKNVSISRTGSGNRAILNEDVDGLKIVLIGQNFLKAEDSSPVRLNNNTTITTQDSNTTTIRGGSEDAITVGDGKTLILDHAKIEVFSEESSALEGNEGTESVIIQGGSKILFLSYSYTIYNLNLFKVDNSFVEIYSAPVGNESKNIKSFQCVGDYMQVITGEYDATAQKFILNTDIGRECIYIAKGALFEDTKYFPDKNFGQALIDIKAAETTQYKKFILFPYGLYAGTAQYTESLNLSNRNISSLKGIEFFTDLVELNCMSNKLVNVDLSKNTKLQTLNMSNNAISSITLPQTTSLTSLLLNNNSLSSVDLTKNTGLTELNVAYNNLLTLDVSKNTLLPTITANSNSLKSINLPQSTVLETINVNSNALTSIDLSKCTALTKIYLNENKLTTLDVSKNTKLKEIECHSNKLITLDFSKNSALKKITCYNNQIYDVPSGAQNGESFVVNLPKTSWPPGELFFATETDNNNLTTEQVSTVNSKLWNLKYSDGTTYLGEQSTGIESIETDAVTGNAPRYNLMGQPVDKNYRGVVIQNGKKTLIK